MIRTDATRLLRGPAHRVAIRVGVAFGVAIVSLVLLVAPSPAPAVGPAGGATGTVIGPGFYPRLIRLEHAGARNGTVLATYQLGQEGRILQSTDGGRSFSPLSVVDVGAETDLAPPGGMCCIELWEMPVALGGFPAGTLLWSGSIIVTEGAVRHNRLAIWRSTDHGLTWQRHGDCAESDGGLWEPELYVADDGSLACLYSDDGQEEVPAGDPVPQELALTVSHDGGLTFGERRDVVVDPTPIGRPGMGTVVRLPDGSWRMTFERCGALPPCQVRIRSSADGLDWGDPRDLGTVVATETGSTFWHTPVLSWSPYGGGAGTLLLTGQIFNRSTGFAEPTSGGVILVNQAAGEGPWTPIDAPVHIPEPFDHYCPNYSSPVLALDGPAIVEMATEWTGDECLVRHGLGTIPDLSDPTTTTTSTVPADPGAIPAPPATPLPADVRLTG